MENINGKTCVTHSELVMSKIITSETLRQLSARGKVQKVQRGGNGREALYSVESLPYKYQVEVYRRYPDHKKTAELKKFVDVVLPDAAAEEFFATYTRPGGALLTPDMQREYSNNAAVLNAFRQIMADSASMKSRTNPHKREKTGEMWSRFASSLDVIADRWPNTLPRNARRLEQKYKEYSKDGYEVLVSGRLLNSNAGKVKTDEQQSLMVLLIRDPHNWNSEEIASRYNEVAAKQEGWKPITAATVDVWRTKVAWEASASQLGTSKFRARKTMQVRRSRPTAAMYHWCLDGWVVELYYQKINEKGLRTYHNRMTMVVVIDTCNNYPVGYAVGERENTALITKALRNAANHTQELFGQRYRAQQIQSDRYGIKSMTPLYEVVGRLVTPAAAHNAKAKVVEPFNRWMNETLFCKCMNWSGRGITSRNDKQPNSEYLNAIRHQLPDEAGVRWQIDGIMEIIRMMKREDYMKFWDACPQDLRLPMDYEQYLQAFGDYTGNRNVLEPSGLHITIEGVKHHYDCFDPAIREYAHVRWGVRYDTADLSHVLAVSEDGTRRFVLEDKYVQPMALVEQTDKDREQLQRVKDYNKVFEGKIINQASLRSASVEKLFNENPQLENTLTRAILCDSKGLHKDRRNDEEALGGNGPVRRIHAVKKQKALPSAPVWSVETAFEDTQTPVYAPLVTPAERADDDIWSDL